MNGMTRRAGRVDSTGHHQRDPHRRAVWPTQPRYPPRITSTLRHRQLQLLQAVLAQLRDEPAVLPAWSLAEVQLTGLASGLTALAGELGLFDRSGDNVTEYVREQRAQVAQRGTLPSARTGGARCAERCRHPRCRGEGRRTDRRRVEPRQLPADGRHRPGGGPTPTGPGSGGDGTRGVGTARFHRVRGHVPCVGRWQHRPHRRRVGGAQRTSGDPPRLGGVPARLHGARVRGAAGHLRSCGAHRPRHRPPRLHRGSCRSASGQRGRRLVVRNAISIGCAPAG